MKTIIKFSQVIFGAVLVIITMNSCKNEHKQEANEVLPEVQTEVNSDIESRDTDADFLEYALENNNFQIEAGKLAMKKGIDQDVKKYATMLVDEHNKSLEELSSLAAKKSLPFPTSLSENINTDYSELSKKIGTNFDKAFILLMVDRHKEAVDKMTEFSQKIKDNDFKLWAARELDVLITHRDQAKKIKEKLGV